MCLVLFSLTGSICVGVHPKYIYSDILRSIRRIYLHKTYNTDTVCISDQRVRFGLISSLLKDTVK